jgi:glyoxylase-like metal-dependent hydrolase (beta-lactamase superfamily II)
VLRSYEVGPLGANCYILSCDASKEAVVIDPGGVSAEMTKHLSARGLKVAYIICTHGHYDHIGGVTELRKHCQAPVLIHADDRPMLVNPKKYVPFAGLFLPDMAEPERLLSGGEMLSLGGLTLEILHTPGHTRGGISIAVEKEGIVFTGDTLFLEGVGRTDLPGGSAAQLTASIRERLFTLPDRTTVYPGHGPQTDIGYEKKHNPFVNDGAEF